MKQRILFVAFKKYSSILEGGGIANARSVSMAKQILGVNNVDVFYMNNEDKRPSVLHLVQSASLLPFGYWNGVTPQKIDSLLAKCQNYDMIFICSSVMGIVAKRLRVSGYKGRIISFFHNVESDYYEARVPKYLPLRSIIIHCARLNDKYSMVYADVRIALTSRDAEKLEKTFGNKIDYIVPVTFPDKCADTVFDQELLTSRRPLCLFIGSNFPANAEGVLWFVENVLPHVDIDFRVVGKGMGELKHHKCMADIDVMSDVADLAPYFLEADFMVLPVFSGSGMKVKTCEALMYGKNIIGSSETFVGYDIDTQKCGRRCDKAGQYIEVLNYFKDHPVRRFNAYSRDVFLKKYSEQVALNMFRDIFDSND